MPKYAFLLLAAACFCSLGPAYAEMSGREKIEAAKTQFRVCADPDNLPFTNKRGEGFENKIAELLARASGQPLVYYWWPARRGFINRTLNAWYCDVVLDVPTGYELTRTTKPYFCSRYVAVHRPGEHFSPSLDDPPARSLRIGVVEQTPPLALALKHNLNPVVYFTDYDYVSNYPGRIVNDVASRKLDVALVWGPIGGYFARHQSPTLQLATLKENGDSNTRLTFPISFGVRRGDKARAERLDTLMHEHTDEIAAILRENGVPLSNDPAQCASPPQHAGREPAAHARFATDITAYPDIAAHRAADTATVPEAPLHYVVDTAARPVAGAAMPTGAGSAPVELAAQQTAQSQPSRGAPSPSTQIKCDGTETMADIQKLGGGSPGAGHPYTVQNGKVDATTYSGWVRFSAFCQVCHGPSGVGSAIAPDLATKVKTLNRTQFETIVNCGLKGNLGTGVMPAWGKNPNIEPYLNDLWAYLRARADGVLGPGRPEKLTASK